MSKSSLKNFKTQTSYSIQIIRMKTELITNVSSDIVEKHTPLKKVSEGKPG